MIVIGIFLISLTCAGILNIVNTTIDIKDKTDLNYIEHEIKRDLVYERTPLISDGIYCKISRMNVKGTDLKVTGLRIKRNEKSDEECIKELTILANSRLRYMIEKNKKVDNSKDDGGIVKFK